MSILGALLKLGIHRGGIHQNVQLVEFIQCKFHQGFDRVRIGHIEGSSGRGPFLLVQFISPFLGSLAVDISHNYIRSGFCQRLCELLSQKSRPASDHCGPAGEVKQFPD